MTSYKKHDVFNGFLVPSSGYIKKFVVLDTGFKLTIPKNKNLLDYINYDIGYNNLIPFFTLVLIKRLQEPIDIGTYFFYFKNDKIEVEYTFKTNPNFEKIDLLTVKEKNIINIRSEINTLKLNDNLYSIANSNYKVDNEDEFFTYLATVLIELDPLDN